MMSTFQDYAYYYNAFYMDKNYKDEANKVNILIKKYGKSYHKIIDFGCGTGRHGIELINLGYQYMGIDISDTMIEIAKENLKKVGMQAELIVSDIKSYESNMRQDVVISLFHVMSYQNSNDDIYRAFVSARNCLNIGGIFLFDVWYGPGVLSDKPTVRVKEVELCENRLIRIARPIMYEKRNTVDVHYDIYVTNKISNTVKKIEETHSMRYFFQPEIELLLEQSRFEFVCNLDCNTLEETSFNSWTSYFIARAI